MILIISTKEDASTKDVIDELTFINKQFIIVQPESAINFSFIGNKHLLEIDNKKIYIENIKSVWYRRGSIELNSPNIENNDISKILFDESVHLKNFIYYLLFTKRHINKKSDNNINKLITIAIAQKNELQIPYSYYNTNEIGSNKIITKTISGNAFFILDNTINISYVKEVTKSQIKNNYENSYFQRKIEKRYELRIFYLHGKFWSMAIFSQKDKQTEVDFRRYNLEKPNRTVPFQLPKEIEGKLHKLMTEININSGSIDMIVTPKLEYYFLEVNPIGQFAMTSFPCNYNLEKEIAEFLTYE